MIATSHKGTRLEVERKSEGCPGMVWVRWRDVRLPVDVRDLREERKVAGS